MNKIPTYDYECGECGYSFEKFQSMTSRVLRMCPKCKEKKINRLIGSGGGIVFRKGCGGFYCKDYTENKPEPSASKKYKKGPAKIGDKDD